MCSAYFPRSRYQCKTRFFSVLKLIIVYTSLYIQALKVGLYFSDFIYPYLQIGNIQLYVKALALNSSQWGFVWCAVSIYCIMLIRRATVKEMSCAAVVAQACFFQRTGGWGGEIRGLRLGGNTQQIPDQLRCTVRKRKNKEAWKENHVYSVLPVLYEHSIYKMAVKQ